MPLRRRTLRSRLVVLSIYILISIRRRARLRTKTVLTTRFSSQLSKLDFCRICCWYPLTPSYSFLLLSVSTDTFLRSPIPNCTFPYPLIPIYLFRSFSPSSSIFLSTLISRPTPEGTTF